MATIPSFHSWGPKPDLAGAAAAGDRLVLDNARMLNEVTHQQNVLRLQAQQAFANHQLELMKLEAATKARETEMQLERQKLELNKALQLQQLSLADRDFNMRQQQANLKTDEYWDQASKYAEYREMYNTKVMGGMDSETAARASMLEVLPPGMNALPSGVLPRTEGGIDGAGGVPYLTPIPLEEGRTAYRTSKDGFRIFDPAKAGKEEKIYMVVGSPWSPSLREVRASEVESVMRGLDPKLQVNKTNVEAQNKARRILGGAGGGYTQGIPSGISWEGFTNRMAQIRPGTTFTNSVR